MDANLGIMNSGLRIVNNTHNGMNMEDSASAGVSAFASPPSPAAGGGGGGGDTSVAGGDASLPESATVNSNGGAITNTTTTNISAVGRIWRIDRIDGSFVRSVFTVGVRDNGGQFVE